MRINREAKHMCVNMVYVVEKHTFFLLVSLVFVIFITQDFVTCAKLCIRFLDAKKVEQRCALPIMVLIVYFQDHN